MKVKNDYENYAKMSVPFETESQLTLAFKAFEKDVEKLRKKHRIAELLIIKVAYLENTNLTSCNTYGSELMVLPMAHIAISNAIKLNGKLIDKLIKAND